MTLDGSGANERPHARFSEPRAGTGSAAPVYDAGMLTDLPNLLTLSRIAAVPVMVALTALGSPGGDLAACAVFAIAAITDYFDGRLARDWRRKRRISAACSIRSPTSCWSARRSWRWPVMAGSGRRGLYPAVVIMLREILVSGLREYLAGLRVGLPVTRLAKWKTGVQMGALGTLLAGDSGAAALRAAWLPATMIGATLLWIAALLTIVTGWDYLVAGLRHAQAGAQPGPAASQSGRGAVLPPP